MGGNPTRSRWLLVLLLGMLALAGCAGAGGLSGQAGPPAAHGPAVIGADEVAASVRRAQQPLAWQLGDAPRVTVAGGQGGKQIAVITKDINPFIQSIQGGIGAAAGTVGMRVLLSDPANSASDAQRRLAQAVAQRVAAIVTVGFTTAEIAAPLRQAAAAAIPVVQLFVSDPVAPPAGSGVFGYVSPCYTCIGAVMADLVIRDSGGRADVVFINAPDVGIATLEANGFRARLREHCGGCTVTVADAPIAQWGSQIPAIAAAAAADQRVNYLVPVFDTATALVVPALAAANAEDRIRLVSSNGDQAQLSDLRDGEAPRWVGNVGVDGQWIGWASVDQVLRALAGQPALADEKIGFRAFTRENIGSLRLAADPSSWYGDAPFARGYRGLWGVG
jgi:ribose transport system substrate-binding protein